MDQVGYRWSPKKYIGIESTYFSNGNPYFQPAFVEFDAHAGYAVTKNISLVATFRNILGTYDQAIENFLPTLGAPAIPAANKLPTALYGLPYGPRTVIITLNFNS